MLEIWLTCMYFIQSQSRRSNNDCISDDDYVKHIYNNNISFPKIFIKKMLGRPSFYIVFCKSRDTTIKDCNTTLCSLRYIIQVNSLSSIVNSIIYVCCMSIWALKSIDSQWLILYWTLKPNPPWPSGSSTTQNLLELSPTAKRS